MPELSSFTVCGTCGSLYEALPSPGFATPQRCACARGTSGDPVWDRYDFNEHFLLCNCCQMEPIRSGSRWSTWFCDDCRTRVLALNAAAGCRLLPIGRHTFMSSIGPSGSAIASDDDLSRLVERFHGAAIDLVAAIKQLDALSQRRGEELRVGMEFGAREDVPLTTWLSRLQDMSRRNPAEFSKLASWDRLVSRLLEEG